MSFSASVGEFSCQAEDCEHFFGLSSEDESAFEAICACSRGPCGGRSGDLPLSHFLSAAAEGVDEGGQAPQQTERSPGKSNKAFPSSREVCMWVVDADKALLFQREEIPADTSSSLARDPAGGSLKGPSTAGRTPHGRSYFWKLMHAATSYVRSRLCSKEPLLFGVLLFNAYARTEGGPLPGESSGQKGPADSVREGLHAKGTPRRRLPLLPLLMPGIAVALPLQEATISTIEDLGLLASLDREQFEEAFAEPPQRPPFTDLWWSLGYMLAGVQQRQKRREAFLQRVFLFTNNPDPCSSTSRGGDCRGEEEEERRACMQRLKDLQSQQAQFVLFPLEHHEGSFDASLFWDEALGQDATEAPYFLLLNTVQQSIEYFETPTPDLAFWR
ncbi:uncharacterized protein LOC113147204 [Cyclospora cayetanensis]|uniref:Uncharacterized protein LOC113147204 n=1 Tax=Cyclospora cayetanensis TaxID=88456 RepID=A0A6P6RZI0_9EIME|nr:uncharacterized protein LOC113147204 [Cyclospora cayetanensis]